MKAQRNIAGVTTLIPLVTVVVATFNTTVSAVMPQVTHNSASKPTTLHNQSKYLVAQFFDNCRRVNGDSSVNVRQEPSNNSPLVKRLANGSRVFIVHRGNKGWVPIYQPVRGYVYADELTSCAVVPGPKNCRRVNGLLGAPVRERPSINSSSIRNLDYGMFVTIGDRRSNGWVEITAPVNGYVAAINLGYCEPE